MRIKTQLTKSLLPKLALNLGAFIKLERAHGWLCNWESLGSKPPGISAGSLGSGCVLLSGTLAVSCKAQQGDELEGRPRHPQRHTEACEAPPCLQGPLVPDTGWLPNKELSSSPFFQTPPLFFFKKKNYQEHMYWSIWTHARPETKEQKAMGRAAGLQGPELTAWFSA